MDSLAMQTAYRWKDVLKAVQKKEENPQQFRRFFIGDVRSQAYSVQEELALKHLKFSNMKSYPIGKPFENVYFTRREAECMILVLRGYTNVQIAELLNLSSRTVEFYVKNMRHKTGCVSKVDLISSISKTNFLDNLDFKLNELI